MFYSFMRSQMPFIILTLGLQDLFEMHSNLQNNYAMMQNS